MSQEEVTEAAALASAAASAAAAIPLPADGSANNSNGDNDDDAPAASADSAIVALAHCASPTPSAATSVYYDARAEAEGKDDAKNVTQDADEKEDGLVLDVTHGDNADADNTDDDDEDEEPNLTGLQQELALAAITLDRSLEEDAIAVAGTATGTATGTPVKAASTNAQLLDDKIQKDAKTSPAKSLATQVTADLSMNGPRDECSDASDSDLYEDCFQENECPYGYPSDDLVDVETGLGGKKKKRRRRRNVSHSTASCAAQWCATRPQRRGWVAVLFLVAVMVGSVLYLLLGGHRRTADGKQRGGNGGGEEDKWWELSPLWSSTGSGGDNGGGSGGGSGAGMTEAAPEEPTAVAGPVANPDGCADDPTWRVMRRDTTTTATPDASKSPNAGGYVLSQTEGCANFVAARPGQHCSKSGVAWVEGATRSATRHQVTVLAREACPVSCGTCDTVSYTHLRAHET